MREKFIRFMTGRYGSDRLNQHGLYLSMVLVILNLFVRSPWIIAAWVVLVVAVYARTFSKKIGKRRAENNAYSRMLYKIKQFFKRIAAFPRYKMFVCASCQTRLRVPRRKGKIEITCPNCKHKFDAKS